MSKPHATLSPLHHRGALHIKVEIPNNDTAKTLISQVTGRKWSKTHGCWYVPYTQAAYRQLKELFEVIVPDELLKKEKPVKSALNMNTMPEAVGTMEANAQTQPVENQTTIEIQQPAIRIEKENNRRLKVYIPQERKEWIEKIETIPGRAWNQDGKYWSVPLVKTVIARLEAWFGEQIVLPLKEIKDLPEDYHPKNWNHSLPLVEPEKESTRLPDVSKIPSTPKESAVALKNNDSVRPVFSKINMNGEVRKVVTGNRVIVRSGTPGWLDVFVPYDKKAWIDHIKRIPGRSYSYDDTCWKVPLNRESIRELKDYFRELLVMTFELPADMPDKWTHRVQIKQQNAPAFQLNETQRLAVTALEERLILESKMPRTIKTYKNNLIGLIAHYPAAKPSQISLKQIQAYIIFKRKESKLSNSAVNSLISALNAFYGRLLGQTEKVQELERPPKKKTLPNVLSTEEVQRLLTASENIKHKCMLLLIYSAGLRKGELLRLRVRDLNAARQCLFVKNGKGGKDRYSFYTPAAIKYVTEYMREYKPRYWLFEGQTGEQYSETSLQIIFDRAREKSGVNPHITIHGLRHSFATHLVEKNVPLHVVKQLLGHEDIKTTEIYLHISNKYMREIKSPLEGMEI